MIKNTFFKENFPNPHDNSLFCRYAVSNEEFEAISNYLTYTSGIDKKLAVIRLKIAQTKAAYTPKFPDDPNFPSDKYCTFVLSEDDAEYFDVACWLFIERRLRQQ